MRGRFSGDFARLGICLKIYYPVLVDADEYLLELLRYIHLNPVRARMVASVDDYPWSSHHAYVGARDEPFVHTGFALRLFASDRVQAVSAYKRFVNKRGLAESSPLAERNPDDRRILGSDDFAAKLLGAAWRPKITQERRSAHQRGLRRVSVTMTSYDLPGAPRIS
jgi:hypothetical protein